VTIVHLERLAGRAVLDADGKHAGRLCEVHGREEGKDLVITHYTLVRGNWIAFLLHELGLRRRHAFRVGWEKLDLSDPERPRLTSGARGR
jgi:hypothetical protein